MTTIGVAIAIPEPHASVLHRHRAAFGDPQADTVPTHLTLVPPTAVDPGDLDKVEHHLEEVASRHAAFPLHMRGTATFRPVSPVVFVALSEGIGCCELLAADARSGPLGQQLCFPYHPHVTVAHDVDDAALDRAFKTLADFDCRFEVGEFCLYLHGQDRVWRPYRRYRLAVPDHDR